MRTSDLIRQIRLVQQQLEAELKKPRPEREDPRSDPELRRALRFAREHERQAMRFCA